MVEEWKNGLLNKYQLDEVVQDNVFFHDFNTIDFPTKSYQMLSDMGQHYQILSLSVTLFEKLIGFSVYKLMIVVGKK